MPLFLLFVCKYLLFTFYSIVSEIVYMRNCFIHELKLENDRGAVETLFLIFIACFYNKKFNPELTSKKKKGPKIGSGWPPYSPTLPDPLLNFTQCYLPMAFTFLQVCAIHTFACNHFSNFKSEKLFTHAHLIKLMPAVPWFCYPALDDSCASTDNKVTIFQMDGGEAFSAFLKLTWN